MGFSGGALRLRLVTADEFPAWIAASRAGYAEGIELHGGQTREAAQRKADHDIAAVLTRGLETPGQALYVVEVGGRPVGRLWLGETESNGRRALFVYDIAIEAGHRGQGYGSAAMRQVEEEARARELRRIELHVFGANGVARRLYRSLGYVETSVRMAKDLGGP